MFLINFNIFFSFNYFFIMLYVIIIFSVILYSLSSARNLISYTSFKKTTTFEYLNGADLYWILLTPVFLLFILNYSWSSPVLTNWFGNLLLTSFQFKISFLVLLVFSLIIYSYCSVFYFTSKDVYDYVIVTFNFLFWIYFLFFVNTLFSFIFFIEILSTLIFLLLITSTFSTTFFYNNLNLNLYSYFTSSMPLFFIQMLMFFFWTSLISSLNLFFFLILFYLKFFTFEWFYFEFLVYYVFTLSQLYDYISTALIWFNFLFCFFLKCGLVPFYFWKPVFFKGIPLHALAFYILFFYFFIFLFFIYFFIIYSNEIFFFFVGLNLLLFLFGVFILLFILCEAYYIKAFLALSSVLNSLFVFLALNSSSGFITLLSL